MQIKISARHGHLSDETQAKIKEKLEKLPRFYDRLTAIDVTVDLEHREAPMSIFAYRPNTSTISWPCAVRWS